MGLTLSLDWKAPGPVAARFMRSTKPTQILNGPIGSGKTTTCFMKAIRIASRQMPSTRDKKRKFKLCVVRDTYRQLWKTTLPSWFKRVPKSVGEFTGAENAPATHRIEFELDDKTVVEFQVDFVAIGENSVEDVLRGYEPTAFYLNEADLLAREVYTYARGRIGRYPDMSEGGPSWYGILMDCNAPELTSWLYLDMFRQTPDDVTLLKQPSGFDPRAENLENLPPGYYENQRSGQPDWYIARMLENKPGYSRAGKPIYKDFQDERHVSLSTLKPIPGLKLAIGFDAGLSPAAVFTQRLPNGQRRILRELVSEPGTGPRRFGRNVVQKLQDEFPAFRPSQIIGYADPSAAYGNDKDAGELSWIEMVAAETGITILAAPTNALIPRLEAVRNSLTMLIDGAPALLLDPGCVILREGFNSGYRFKKLPGTEIERYAEEPDKTPHSHPHDALQYVCSAEGGDIEIRDRKEHQFRAAAGAPHVHEWDPFQRSA